MCQPDLNAHECEIFQLSVRTTHGNDYVRADSLCVCILNTIFSPKLSDFRLYDAMSEFQMHSSGLVWHFNRLASLINRLANSTNGGDAPLNGCRRHKCVEPRLRLLMPRLRRDPNGW